MGKGPWAFSGLSPFPSTSSLGLPGFSGDRSAGPCLGGGRIPSPPFHPSSGETVPWEGETVAEKFLSGLRQSQHELPSGVGLTRGKFFLLGEPKLPTYNPGAGPAFRSTTGRDKGSLPTREGPWHSPPKNKGPPSALSRPRRSGPTWDRPFRPTFFGARPAKATGPGSRRRAGRRALNSLLRNVEWDHPCLIVEANHFNGRAQ